MRVLIACEESQAVCKAFRLRGHEAYRRILVTFRNRLEDTLSGTYTEMLWHLLMGGRS